MVALAAAVAGFAGWAVTQATPAGAGQDRGAGGSRALQFRRLPAISRRRGTLAITFLPDRTIEVSADEASGLIRNGKLAGTPR